MARIESQIRNGIGSTPIRLFDYFMVKFIMIAGLMPLFAVATIIVSEKNDKSATLIDRTLTSRWTNLFALITSQLIIFSPEILIMMACLPLTGVYINYGVNWGLLFLASLLLSVTSISLGLLIGLLTSNVTITSVVSFIVLIALELLGGTFFTVNPAVTQWMPTYYASETALFTVIEGRGFDLVGPLIAIGGFIGFSLFLIANLVFSLKRHF